MPFFWLFFRLSDTFVTESYLTCSQWCRYFTYFPRKLHKSMKTGSTKKKSETYCRFCEAKTWKKKISCGKYILSKQLFFHYKNTRKSCEICSKLMIKTERRQWRCPEVFIVKFEHNSRFLLVFLSLTLKR